MDDDPKRKSRIRAVDLNEDVTERKQDQELRLRNRISQIFLTVTKEEFVYAEVLDVVLEVMESKYGIFGYIDEDGAFVVPSMTRHIWDKCQVSDKRFIFPRDQWGKSTWPEAIRQMKAIYLNTPSNETPEGHIRIKRHISLPIIFQDEVIGLFQVANKETDYAESDVDRLTLIADIVAPVLNARLQRDRQEKACASAEAELSDAKDYTDNIIRSLTDTLLVIDPKGRIKTVNQATLDLLGYTEDEIIGKPVGMLLEEEGEEEEEEETALAETPLFKGERLKRLLKDGYIRDFEMNYLTKSGTIIPMLFSGSVMKDKEGKITSIVCIAKDIRERKSAEEKLEHFKNAVEGSSDAIGMSTPEGKHWFQNKAFDSLFGKVGDNPPAEVFVDQKEGEKVFKTIMAGNEWSGEVEMYGTDKEVLTVFLRANAIKDENRKIVGLIGVHTDITERKQAEMELKRSQEQLFQSQKLEATGQLAGGIAHDFNNLLTSILACTGFVREGIPEGDPKLDDLDEIKKAGERAAALTRQLLAFSRKQVLNPKVLDLNIVIEELQKLLRRTISEQIEIALRLAPTVRSVKADESQLGQVLLNLAVNASAAMPGGGRLLIGTADVQFPEPVTHNKFTIPAGTYVMCSVSDTGDGIASDTLDKIFDPFFTTKEVGEGTGLGLSTVYGIIKQSGGFVTVYSEEGHGATFRIYLPATQEPQTDSTEAQGSLDSLRGSETILLAEDDSAVRNVSLRILRNCGYKLLEASTGEEALRMSQDYKKPIHLLLTDVVMPGMDGAELARHIKSARPDTKIIFTSGYPGEVIFDRGNFISGRNFISKPFSPSALAALVRKSLDSPQKD
ncbi:PAS domain S-box protein [Elusimicrobiota bacterium]